MSKRKKWTTITRHAKNSSASSQPIRYLGLPNSSPDCKRASSDRNHRKDQQTQQALRLRRHIFHHGSTFFSAQLIILLILALTPINLIDAAMTMKQLQSTLDTMRNVCAPKYPSLSKEVLDNIKNGGFDESSKDLKCYIKCIADMAGTTTKKGDLDMKKSMTQVENVLPDEMREHARAALTACKDVPKSYKDPCDKLFHTAKCSYDYGPDKFMFP